MFFIKEVFMQYVSFYACILCIISCISCSSTRTLQSLPYAYNGPIITPEKRNGALHRVKEEFIYQDERITLILVYWSDGNVQLQKYTHNSDKGIENINIKIQKP